MENKNIELKKLPQKSHEILLKLLNNIGIVGVIFASIADIIFVVIFVVGIKFEVKSTAVILFSVINALIGVLINFLLRYQGKRYAELENEELCKMFYKEKIKKTKRYISMDVWLALNTIKDVIVKGFTTSFSIFGIIYISIEGSKNPIQILITLVTLIMFICFGLISMNSAYCRFYNVQVPYMEKQIKEQGEQENGID